MSITAMKQARKSLSDLSNAFDEQEAAYQVAEQAIYALDQAIEQAEKQEHAEQLAEKGWQYFDCPACGSEGAQAFPKPVQRCTLCNYQHGHAIGCKNNPVDIALAKSAQPAPTQEHQINQLEKLKNHVLANADALGVVLDTPAAQRQWVGLTEEEICAEALKKDQQGIGFIKGAEWADAKLKEKNT